MTNFYLFTYTCVLVAVVFVRELAKAPVGKFKFKDDFLLFTQFSPQ
jgi:hypothetical protein